MSQLNGVFPAIVIDNVDPDKGGRIKVRLPQVEVPGQEVYEAWARIATVMAGTNRSAWFIPDPNDEVLVAFEAGDTRRPIVIGGLWNGTDAPPETTDSNNSGKLLRSRTGLTVTLDDQSGRERFIVETPGGQRITLRDGQGSIEIADRSGNSVILETRGIMVKARGKVTLSAGQVEINSGVVSVNARLSKFSGVVQCDALVTNSVVSSS